MDRREFLSWLVAGPSIARLGLLVPAELVIIKDGYPDIKNLRRLKIINNDNAVFWATDGRHLDFETTNHAGCFGLVSQTNEQFIQSLGKEVEAEYITARAVVTLFIEKEIRHYYEQDWQFQAAKKIIEADKTKGFIGGHAFLMVNDELVWQSLPAKSLLKVFCCFGERVKLQSVEYQFGGKKFYRTEMDGL